MASVEIRITDGNNSVLGGSIVLIKKEVPPKGTLSYTLVGMQEIKDSKCLFQVLDVGNYEYILPYNIKPTVVLRKEFTIINQDDQLLTNLDIEADFKVVIKDKDSNAVTQVDVGDYVTAEMSPQDSSWGYKCGDPWKEDTAGSGLFKAKALVAGRVDCDLFVTVNPDMHLLPVVVDANKLLKFKLGAAGFVDVEDKPALPVAGKIVVSHARSVAEVNGPMSFFVKLLDSSKSLEFPAYKKFIDRVFCGEDEVGDTDATKKLREAQKSLEDYGVGGYDLLKTATEVFLLKGGCVTNQEVNAYKNWPRDYQVNTDHGNYSQITSDEWKAIFNRFLGNNRLPYINKILDTALSGSKLDETKSLHFCSAVLSRSRVTNPCFVELIWNYWHEEAMLVQTINAISRRFQNQRAPGERDPLAHVEIDPLRPLNNILWGYVEEERDRLSIMRRAHEYQHQYGLELYGKAIANMRPADSRSKFLEAFHNLLNKCADYFRAKQDTTVDPDGYPMLHAIQELNLILAHGAHNQFGDLAWTSRVEMLMQEWILARPEIRDFLQSRIMVPHKEAWMPQVDTMKTLQGWSDVAVTHFRDLGVLGEQILLTIRWHNWYEVTNEDEAKGWADLMRPYIQSYIHAYRAVTGVDLSATDGVDFTMPSVLLRKRLATQHAPR